MGSNPSLRPGAFALAVSDAIRRELGSRNMSRRELARQLGVSEKYIRERLNDVQSLSLEDIDRICSVLEIDSIAMLRQVAESLDES